MPHLPPLSRSRAPKPNADRFVDCHTHAVFYGGRAEEFEQRARGVSYEEIARRGGGIRSSMRSLREASDAQLVASVRKHFDRFLDLGTTTIEAKSGYGLSLKHEIRSLRALGIKHDLEVVRTCLAAHSVPPEFDTRRDTYINLVCNEILPAVAAENLAQYCDVFCEKGVFDFGESERMLEAGKKCHLRSRVHADQLSPYSGLIGLLNDDSEPLPKLENRTGLAQPFEEPRDQLILLGRLALLLRVALWRDPESMK